MGYYINPPDMTKEEWLQKNGELSIAEPTQHKVGDKIVVRLVDNGAFTAAAVAYSLSELQAFLYPNGRPRRWYYVPIDKVRELIPDLPQ